MILYIIGTITSPHILFKHVNNVMINGFKVALKH